MATTPFERMAELTTEGRPYAVATVVRTVGSTPQVVGARLVVTEADRPFGTLGGGCVEADALLAARDVLSHGGRSLREYRLTEDLAWNSGLVCGGTMWILAERHDTAFACGEDDGTLDVIRAARGGPPVALVTRLVRERRGLQFDGRIAVLGNGRMIGSFGDVRIDAELSATAADQLAGRPPRLVALDPDHDAIIEPVTSRPRLIIAGGGHVARALARQATCLDFDVTILEDRPEFADPERFEGATVTTGPIASSIGALEYGPQTFLVIATRGHKLDAECILAAVKTGAPYIGLLGSRRKIVLIAAMLRDEGIDARRIDAIHAPVGLDLGGRTPGEIALSVMAEITQARYGGSGRPLRENSPPSV